MLRSSEAHTIRRETPSEVSQRVNRAHDPARVLKVPRRCHKTTIKYSVATLLVVKVDRADFPKLRLFGRMGGRSRNNVAWIAFNVVFPCGGAVVGIAAIPLRRFIKTLISEKNNEDRGRAFERRTSASPRVIPWRRKQVSSHSSSVITDGEKKNWQEIV